MNKTPDSTTLVILGASGDLTKRLLMPALFRLHRLKLTPGLKILGYARQNWGVEHFHDHIHKALQAFAEDFSETQWQRFAANLDYVSGELNSTDLQAIEQQLSPNTLFYLALPPPLFGDAAQALGEAGYAQAPRGAWRRLMVEK